MFVELPFDRFIMSFISTLFSFDGMVIFIGPFIISAISGLVFSAYVAWNNLVPKYCTSSSGFEVFATSFLLLSMSSLTFSFLSRIIIIPIMAAYIFYVYICIEELRGGKWYEKAEN